jgi:hypothetical protein
MSTQTEPSDAVFEQLKAIRDGGQTNMLDRKAVQNLSYVKGHTELEMYLDGLSRREYGELIMEEFAKWLEEND